jgi:hypothetical protein
MIGILIFIYLYMAIAMWDVMRVNNLMGKMVDPAGYQRAHPAAPVEPAPRLVIPGQTLPPHADRG